MPDFKFIPVIVVLTAVVAGITVADELPPQFIYAADKNLLPLAVDELPLRRTPDLALKLLQQHQPEPDSENIHVWLGWEKKRIQLLQQTAQWQVLRTRCDETASLLKKIEFDTAERNGLRTQCIQAQLELGEYDAVLMALRTLMWQTGASTDMIAQWRRMIIQAYLGMDALEDAERATRRYQQDYGDSYSVLSWQLMQAQLFMRTGRAQQAVDLLAGAAQPQAQAMLLLAQMQAKILSPAGVRDKLKPLLDNPQLEDTTRVLYLYVRYQSALADQNHALQMDTLEHLLASRNVAVVYSVFSDGRKFISPDQLWQVYEDYAALIANRQNLLRGDDHAWHALANQLATTEPAQAKALYAMLILHADDAGLRQTTLLQLADMLGKQGDNGLEIVRQLYLQSSVLHDIELVPLSVRYKLVDQAVARADLTTAAQLMETLMQPPDGQDAFGWNLRRARVMILGGHYAESAQVLRSMMPSAQLDAGRIDQYLQVVFDLQSVQQHALALDMFALLEQQPLDVKHQRELAYWKAESLQKLGKYEQAAWLYLKSAQAPDGAQDPWYHTASFQAAEALAQAGLINDARRQYSELLRITANAARQALIRQRLQELLLQQGRKKTEAR